MQGRNLEEIDQLFEAGLPAWKFHKFETEGISHDLAVLDQGKAGQKTLELENYVEARAAHETVAEAANQTSSCGRA